MAIPASTAGDYFYIPEALMAGKPKSGYTPVKGHLVREEDAAANEWDRVASGEKVEGIIVSINGNPSNGTITVAKLIPEVSTITLEYIGTDPAIGERMEGASTPGLGTVTMTDRDVIELDDTNGNLEVRAVNTTAMTVVVKRIGVVTATEVL